MRTGAAAIAIGALVPLLLLAAWARLAPVGSWELALLVALQPDAGLHSDLVRALNTLGNLDVWGAVVLLLSALALAARRAWAALIVALTLFSDLAAYAIKVVVERARPQGANLQDLLGGESFSFPSGHVVRVTALAGVLAWLIVPERLRLPLALATAVVAGTVMGYGRVAVGVHWPTDVIGGVFAGVVWVFASIALLQDRAREESAGAHPPRHNAGREAS